MGSDIPTLWTRAEQRITEGFNYVPCTPDELKDYNDWHGKEPLEYGDNIRGLFIVKPVYRSVSPCPLYNHLEPYEG